MDASELVMFSVCQGLIVGPLIGMSLALVVWIGRVVKAWLGRRGVTIVIGGDR